jgi:hypothetical protein
MEGLVMSGSRSEHERRKQEVGMAPRGTPEYTRNAVYVIGAHAASGYNADSRGTLEDVASNSPDPVARALARYYLSIEQSDEVSDD